MCRGGCTTDERVTGGRATTGSGVRRRAALRTLRASMTLRSELLPETDEIRIDVAVRAWRRSRARPSSSALKTFSFWL